jgi:hypothetical protein
MAQNFALVVMLVLGVATEDIQKIAVSFAPFQMNVATLGELEASSRLQCVVWCVESTCTIMEIVEESSSFLCKRKDVSAVAVSAVQLATDIASQQFLLGR